MPAGCLPLCRYDTTRAQVKATFDAHQCGILNVAPFLDCASQAADNRACCTARGIAAKRYKNECANGSKEDYPDAMLFTAVHNAKFSVIHATASARLVCSI